MNIKNLKLLKPFKVFKRIGIRAYKLQLPHIIKIYPVFYISLLKIYYERPKSTVDVPLYKVEVANEEYEIEAILDYKIKYRKPQYLVK